MILKIDREVYRSFNLFSIDRQIGKTRILAPLLSSVCQGYNITDNNKFIYVKIDH